METRGRIMELSHQNYGHIYLMATIGGMNICTKQLSDKLHEKGFLAELNFYKHEAVEIMKSFLSCALYAFFITLFLL